MCLFWVSSLSYSELPCLQLVASSIGLFHPNRIIFFSGKSQGELCVGVTRGHSNGQVSLLYTLVGTYPAFVRHEAYMTWGTKMNSSEWENELQQITDYKRLTDNINISKPRKKTLIFLLVNILNCLYNTVFPVFFGCMPSIFLILQWFCSIFYRESRKIIQALFPYEWLEYVLYHW